MQDDAIKASATMKASNTNSSLNASFRKSENGEEKDGNQPPNLAFAVSTDSSVYLTSQDEDDRKQEQEQEQEQEEQEQAEYLSSPVHEQQRIASMSEEEKVEEGEEEEKVEEGAGDDEEEDTTMPASPLTAPPPPPALSVEDEEEEYDENNNNANGMGEFEEPMLEIPLETHSSSIKDANSQEESLPPSPDKEQAITPPTTKDTIPSAPRSIPPPPPPSQPKIGAVDMDKIGSMDNIGNFNNQEKEQTTKEGATTKIPKPDEEQPENSAGSQPKKKKVNPKYEDVHTTGRWGEISQAEKLAVAVFVFAIIIAIVVAVVIILNKPPAIIETIITQPPTEAPIPISSQEKLDFILYKLSNNNVTGALSLTTLFLNMDYDDLYQMDSGDVIPEYIRTMLSIASTFDEDTTNDDIPLDPNVTTYVDLFPKDATDYEDLHNIDTYDSRFHRSKDVPYFIRAMSWFIYQDKYKIFIDEINYDAEDDETSDMFLLRYTLACLYYSLNGNDWYTNTNWLTTSYSDDEKERKGESDDPVHICSWYGIKCDFLNKTITDIEIRNNNVGGESDSTLPLELVFLEDLRGLSLQNNSIGGQIPGYAFANLPKFFALYLQNNTLQGSIPLNLNDNGILQYLFLQGNNLTGIFADPYCTLIFDSYWNYTYSVPVFTNGKRGGFGLDCNKKIECYCCENECYD